MIEMQEASTEYEVKENENLIMQSKIIKEDKLLNIVTI